MQKVIFVIFCICLIFKISLSQSDTYKLELKKNIELLESNNHTKALIGLEALTKSDPKNWLTYYYAGLCNVLIASKKSKTEIDTWCDKATFFATKADSLSPKNSEVKVLQSLISATKIVVNKTQRGQKYGMLSIRYANEAITLNTKNPRAHFVKAQTLLNTPKAFGGGAPKAKKEFEIALDLFNKQSLHETNFPNWGKHQTIQELGKFK